MNRWLYKPPRFIFVVGLGLILPVLTVFSVAKGADDLTLYRLMHDPFQKPQKLLPAPQAPAAYIKEQENVFQTTSKLTATLRNGKNSMVIVNGKTVQLGETIAGYRLIRVDDLSAVFSKDGQQHILEIDKINESK